MTLNETIQAGGGLDDTTGNSHVAQSENPPNKGGSVGWGNGGWVEQ